MKRFFVGIALIALLGAALGVAWGYYFAHSKLILPDSSVNIPLKPFEFTVKQGASLKSLSRQLTDAGLLPEPQLFWLIGRLTSQATGIHAGTYRLEAPLTPLELLQKLNDGDVVAISVTFVEGITFADMRARLEKSENVKVTLKGLSNADVLKRIGATESHPEGLFFPDTYRFPLGATDGDARRAFSFSCSDHSRRVRVVGRQ